MKRSLLVLLLIFAVHCPLCAGDDSRGPREEALEEFDEGVNGSTYLHDAIPPADREAMMKEHREDEDWAMEDEMWGIEDELWYEHARQKGWLDDE